MSDDIVATIKEWLQTPEGAQAIHAALQRAEQANKELAEARRLEAYKAEAEPRLRQLDELALKCAWGKWAGDCTPEERAARDRWERLMNVQSRAEMEAGL